MKTFTLLPAARGLAPKAGLLVSYNDDDDDDDDACNLYPFVGTIVIL